MTSPEDDGLEEALRRALSEAASGVEPGTDGLDKIRARIGDRPPRPWLLSVLFGVVERVRYWSWRGHWAWPTSLSKLSGLRGPRSRRSNFPRWGLGSLRLAVVLAGIAAIAAITLGIQPFRHVILQASAALNGDSGSQQVSAGTEGSGTPTVGGSAAPALSAASSGQTGASGSPGAPGAAATSSNGQPHPVATGKCVTSTLPVVVGTRSSATDVTPRASGTAVPATTTGPATITGPAGPSPAASAQPYDTGTSAVTCPVSAAPKSAATKSAATKSAAPTPSSSPSPTVTTPAATAQAPDYTDPSATPTPTASAVAPSSAGDDSPSPSAPPSWWSWPDRRRGGHPGLGGGGSRRR